MEDSSVLKEKSVEKKPNLFDTVTECLIQLKEYLSKDQVIKTNCDCILLGFIYFAVNLWIKNHMTKASSDWEQD